jgi:hypothetical protein
MIKKYLPPEEARLQSEGFATGSWVKEHGEHVTWKSLIDSYQTLIDNWVPWTGEQINKYWVQEIGAAQLILPMHVLQEYCEPKRPFYPVPNFKDDIILVRSLPDWFSFQELSHEWAIARGKHTLHAQQIKDGWSSSGCRKKSCKSEAVVRAVLDDAGLHLVDMVAIYELYVTRVQQRQELVAAELIAANLKTFKPT